MLRYRGGAAPAEHPAARIPRIPCLQSRRAHTEPAKLTKLVRGELDWIVMKALEEDRGRRYETANGFAMDVQRYPVDEPVQACSPSAWYRMRNQPPEQENPNCGSAGRLALILGTVGSTWQAIEATAAREAESKARMEEREARGALDIAREEQEQQRLQINRDLSDALVEVAGSREKSRAAPTGDAEPWNQFRAVAACGGAVEARSRTLLLPAASGTSSRT